MQIGFLSTKPTCDFLPLVEKMLAQKGHELVCSLQLNKDAEFAEGLNFVAMQTQAVIYYGDRNRLFDCLKNDYEVDAEQSIFELNETLYAVMDEFSEQFVSESIIPMLNSRCKTLYTTEIFKTFGKTEAELREILKDYIRNRNRIVFSFYPSLCECEVNVRYSSKMAKETVDELLRGVAAALNDCTYALKDVSLEQQLMDLLRVRGKKVCVAESFTGGGIAAALTGCPGASDIFKEGLVCYSNASKIQRLGVEEQLIESYGAVSIETVYEMAANLLLQDNCDVCLATSGNAGPTAEKDGDVGLCFIAVGDMNGIHIYRYVFEGDRKKVTYSGVKYALYHLYKKLKEKEFDELLRARQRAENEINEEKE